MISACKTRISLILSILALMVALWASLTMGRFALSLRQILEIALCGGGDAMARNVFLNIRLPRTLLVAISGMGLALAGWTYQSLFMNVLASPDVLGVGSGCSVGAVLGILMGAGGMSMQFMALGSGLMAVVLSMALARWIGRQRSAALLLSGIIVGAVCNAVLMLFKYLADPNRQLAVIDYWLMGSFHTAKWRDIASVLPMVFICGAVILALRHPIRLMSLGDEEAMSLGIPAAWIRRIALLCATAAVAAIVSVAGIVSWIGLIVPHMSRIWIKQDAPAPCLLLGGCLLLVADTIARCAAASEIPISILTSLMGAAFLLILLGLRRRGGMA